MEDENRKVEDEEESKQAKETPKDKDKETKPSTIKEGTTAGKSGNEGDNLTYTEDTGNQTDEHGDPKMRVTIENRLGSNETEKDEATTDMKSGRNSKKENETAESVNYPLSPISKSSRGEEDLYLNEYEEEKEVEEIKSSTNSNEHSQTNQIHSSPIQGEMDNRELENRKATVSPSGDTSIPIDASDSKKQEPELDEKDEKSSSTSPTKDSDSEFRFASTNGEKETDVHSFNEPYDKSSPKHDELQQLDGEVGANNSSSNKDEVTTERSEDTDGRSLEHDSHYSEGISTGSSDTGHKFQNVSDEQKLETIVEKKNVNGPRRVSPYSENNQKDEKNMVKDARLDVAVKRKSFQTQSRNNYQTHSKCSSQTQFRSGTQSPLKTSFGNYEKQKPNTGPPVSNRNMQSGRSNSRNSGTFRRSNQTTPSAKEIVARQHQQRMTKSATPTLLHMKTRPETRSSRSYSRARTEVSQDGKKKQEFFRLELRRIKTGLEKEASKIKKPKERDYYPFVWTSLAPYYDTTTAQYLIPLDNEEDKEKEQKDGKKEAEATEEKHSKKRNPEKEKLAYEKSTRAYLTRHTAIGLCDPWVDLSMDKSFLHFPKIETPEEKQKRQTEKGAKGSSAEKGAKGSSAEKGAKGSSAEKGEKAKKPRPPKEGSTRLPKFPVISLEKKELASKPLHYNDVPMLRSEFETSFSLNSKERMRKDYKRTKEDFYRMELDRLNEIHKLNRPHMRQAYFAYLQNTPGSKEAIYDCMTETGFIKKKNNPVEQPKNESAAPQNVEVKA